VICHPRSPSAIRLFVPSRRNAWAEVRALHRRAPEVRAIAVPAELVLWVGACGRGRRREGRCRPILLISVLFCYMAVSLVRAPSWTCGLVDP
jgi:hypothetical protein